MQGKAQKRAVGQRVKNARERLGWSQQALAEHAGMRFRGRIHEIERGDCGLQARTLFRLATALGVSVAWLQGEEKQPLVGADRLEVMERRLCVLERALGWWVAAATVALTADRRPGQYRDRELSGQTSGDGTA
jgi:transcriptional regulator with XRE-family HTH domain